MALIALLPIAAPAAAALRTFSCAGMMIEPQGQTQSPKTVRLTIGSPKGVSIDTDGHIVNMPVLSNNRIQL